MTNSAIVRLRGPGWFYEEDPTWPPASLSEVLGWVSDVAVRRSGSVLIFQRRSPQILEIRPDGEIVDSFDLETVVEPHGIIVAPSGDVYLVDRDGQQVLVLEDGRSARVVLGPEAGFAYPTDVAVDPQSGDLFVADGYGNAKVHRFSASGELITEWGRHGTRPGEFNIVHTIALDNSGRVLVADRENGRIQIFDQDGGHLESWDAYHRPLGLDIAEDGVVIVSEGSTRLTGSDDQGRKIAVGRAPDIVHALAVFADLMYLAIPARRTVVRLVRRPDGRSNSEN